MCVLHIEQLVNVVFDILAPPIITVPPIAEIEVELGNTFTIYCEAVGVPEPLIVWRLNWGNIPTGDRVSWTNEDGRGVLTIEDARYSDAGAYTCEAINNRGSIFAIPDALVIVRRKLYIIFQTLTNLTKAIPNPFEITFFLVTTSKSIVFIFEGFLILSWPFFINIHKNKLIVRLKHSLSRLLRLMSCYPRSLS